jgi:transposase-like protein
MPTLSHVHQLFSTETCHTYLRTLRWKDRLFQCPHCHSPEVGPWGTYHYRPGFKRYRCKDCGRTFNDLTKTLLS